MGISFCVSLSWMFAFLMVKYFPILNQMLSMYGCMALFASCSFIGFLFSVFVLPETKGKSYDEILRMLEG